MGNEAAEEREWLIRRTLLRQKMSEVNLPSCPIHHPAASLVRSVTSSSDAGVVLDVTRQAFAEYGNRLNPPSGANSETLDEIKKSLDEHGGVVCWIADASADKAVGSVRFQLQPTHLYLGRLAVLPEERRRGIASALMDAVECIASRLELPEIRLGTRMQLVENVRFYKRHGYELMRVSPHPRGSDEIGWFVKSMIKEKPLGG